jgi:hypothetical protein
VTVEVDGNEPFVCVCVCVCVCVLNSNSVYCSIIIANRIEGTF